MQDKTMVNDVLSSVNSSLTNYANVIAQTANPQLRQTIIQIRNSDETFQYNLFRVAEQKGFYNPAESADDDDVITVRNQLSV